MLSSRAIALQGVGYSPALIAAHGLLAADEAIGSEADSETGGGFDAPYRAYVKRITEERAAEWQKSLQDVSGTDGPLPIASSESLDYDSRVGQGAPAAGASPVLESVAPSLIHDAERSIVLTKQALGAITRTAAMTARQRLDDEAAMLALFALMMDDD